MCFDVCSICLDKLDDIALSCHPEEKGAAFDHIFHRTCLHESLKRSQNCPLCRKQIIQLESSYVLEKREETLLDAITKKDRVLFEAVFKWVFFNKKTLAKAALMLEKEDLSDLKAVFLKKVCMDEALVQAIIDLSFDSTEGLKSKSFPTFIMHYPFSLKIIFLKIIETKNLEALKRFKTYFRLQPQLVSEMLLLASQKGTFELILPISQLAPLSYYERNKSCLLLAKAKRYDLVILLMKEGPISDFVKIRIINFLEMDQNLELIQQFLPAIPFFNLQYDHVLSETLIEGAFEEALHMIKYKSISRECFEAFITQSIVAKKEGIVLEALSRMSLEKRFCQSQIMLCEQLNLPVLKEALKKQLRFKISCFSWF